MKLLYYIIGLFASLFVLHSNTVFADTLIDAARKADINRIKLLLNGDANVNSKRNGMTALHWAVVVQDDHVGQNRAADRLSIVNILIENGADVNAQDDDGDVPLMSVYTLDIAATLIKNGVNLNTRNKRGRTPLMEVLESAARTSKGYDYLSIVELLLSSGAKVNISDNDKNTALMEAVSIPDAFNFVKILLENGATIDAKNKYGETALMLSSSLPVIKLLINHGANVNQKDRRGKTVFNHLARRADYSLSDNKKKEYFEALYKLGINVSIHDAAIYNIEEIVSDYIAKGGNVDALDKSEKRTALHHATQYANVGIARALLDAGADPNIEDKWGITPLELSVFDVITYNKKYIRKKDLGDDCLWNKEIFDLLLLHNINVRPRKLLYNAIRANDPQLLDYIVSTWNPRDFRSDGELVYYAVVGGAINSLQWAIDHGVEVNKSITNNFTPLHIAAMHNKVKAAEMLLNAGASDSLVKKDSSGRTPLDIASSEGYSDIITLFREKAIEVTRKNDKSKATVTVTEDVSEEKIREYKLSMDSDGTLRVGSNPHLLTVYDEKGRGVGLSAVLTNTLIDMKEIPMKTNPMMGVQLKNNRQVAYVSVIRRNSDSVFVDKSGVVFPRDSRNTGKEGPFVSMSLLTSDSKVISLKGLSISIMSDASTIHNIIANKAGIYIVQNVEEKSLHINIEDLSSGKKWSTTIYPKYRGARPYDVLYKVLDVPVGAPLDNK